MDDTTITLVSKTELANNYVSKAGTTLSNGGVLSGDGNLYLNAGMHKGWLSDFVYNLYSTKPQLIEKQISTVITYSSAAWQDIPNLSFTAPSNGFVIASGTLRIYCKTTDYNQIEYFFGGFHCSVSNTTNYTDIPLHGTWQVTAGTSIGLQIAIYNSKAMKVGSTDTRYARVNYIFIPS